MTRIDATEYPVSRHEKKNVTAPFTGMQARWPDYSGYYAYETEIDLKENRAYTVEIENAYEAVEGFLDGKSVGMRLQKPFVFELCGETSGKHTLRIEVATTLERKVKAMGADIRSMSPYRPLSPTGIVGKVTLTRWEE